MGLPRMAPAGWIWLLCGLIAVAAAAVYFPGVAAAEPLASPHLPWWVIGLGVALAEVCVVHLEFRRSAHSFSLADIPIVFGLLFASGDGLVLGAVAASAVVYAARRLPPIKLAFTCVQLWLAVSVAVVLTRLMAQGGGLAPGVWVGVYAATFVSGALTISCIAAAIRISEGHLPRQTLAQMFGMDAVVTVTNTSIAIVAAVAISADPRVVPVVAAPALAVFAVYRAYVSERQRHERLEFLYDANRTLSHSAEVADALEGLLSRSLEAFRAEIAEVILFHSDGPPLRTTLGPGAGRSVMQPVDPAVAEALAAMLDQGRPAVSLTPPFASAELRSYLEHRGVRHAMAASLPGEERAIGIILLANRFGLERSFTPDDLRLLEALANNASVALQYDRLEQAIAKLRALQEQLHHQAYHDPLTDLPNRALFLERVREERARPGCRLAGLFVDVDDFKTVNDSLGHAIGDELLVGIAQRLRECLRPEDVVARLGGDEFAVLLSGSTDQLARARMIARRLIDAFDVPVRAGHERVSVHLSVGIASSPAHGEEADELIRHADVAMYQAKSKGKGRSEIFQPFMADAIQRRHGLKEQLAKALNREQIIVQYQPIVTLETGRIAAAEALVRWKHPVNGVVSPAEFVPLAEETGLIVPIGHHVLREACRQARAWEQVDPAREPLRMHVNLSVVELRDPGLVDAIVETLSETGVV